MIHSLKARYVFPVAGEPIADGVVTFDQQRIISVFAAANAKRQTDSAIARDAAAIEDLGNVAILPGLVNAHTHLEFSRLKRPIGRRGMRLSEWIEELTGEFRHQDRPPANAVVQGLRQCEAAGVTTLGEIAQPHWHAEDFQNAPLDATVFIELIAPTGIDVDARLRLAEEHIAMASQQSGADGPAPRWRAGISPHAPYTVHPRLLSAAVDISARQRVPLAIHLAESPEEIELLKTAGGPFRCMLQRMSRWEAAAHPPGRTVLDLLRVLAAAHRVLIIHGNYLDDEQIDFIAGHAQRISIIYCPRTHHYFNHPPHPLEKLLGAGVNVALGSDSRASAPDLDLLAEMRQCACSHPSIPPATILRMGTLCGAEALGRQQEVGSLEPGKRPDLCIVALPERQTHDPHQLLFDPSASVCGSWHRGCKTRFVAADEGLK